MRVALFGKGERFEACKKVLDKFCEYSAVVVNEKYFDEGDWYPKNYFDIYILAGLLKIVSSKFINAPKIMTINLHAGKLPEYRGSSPLNWALINGEKEYTLSIIKVDEGIDTGDVLYERTLNILDTDDIKSITKIANFHFPDILEKVLSKIEKGFYNDRFNLIEQKSFGNYYPMRFPEDSILWFDRLSAKEVRNMVKALNDDRYRAYAMYRYNNIYFKKCEIPKDNNYYGTAGRIFRIDEENKRLLVGTKDKAVWLYPTVFGEFKRYGKFTTIENLV